VTAPTYQWRFRYNAGSSSSYKWEFVGGTDAWLDIVDWVASGLGAWQYTGAGFYPPRAGVYDVDSQCRVSGAAGGQHYSATAVSGGVPPISAAYGGSGYGQIRSRGRHTIVAGDYFSQATYSATAAGTFVYRSLAIRPVRVA
jgi:hypothetical protein